MAGNWSNEIPEMSQAALRKQIDDIYERELEAIRNPPPLRPDPGPVVPPWLYYILVSAEVLDAILDALTEVLTGREAPA